MTKKIFTGLVIVLGIVSIAAWEGNTMEKPEADTSQRNEEQMLIEQIYVVEPELEMIQVEHTKSTEEEENTYELTEEEERLGLKL